MSNDIEYEDIINDMVDKLCKKYGFKKDDDPDYIGEVLISNGATLSELETINRYFKMEEY